MGLPYFASVSIYLKFTQEIKMVIVSESRFKEIKLLRRIEINQNEISESEVFAIIVMYLVMRFHLSVGHSSISNRQRSCCKSCRNFLWMQER